MSEIHFGTAGWSYPDWKGIVYPAPRERGFDELGYLASYFGAVEINSTFYRPPEAKHAASWVRRTAGAEGFLFTLKLHRRFTHERKERWSEGEAETFRRGIEPIVSSGRLGAVLLQFPWSFANTEANRRWLADLAGAFSSLPLVAELRQAGWLKEASLKFLASLDIGFCNIDQPASSKSTGPTALITSKTGYVRFHGRNRKAWFDRNAGRDERYDYLYDEEELREWAPRIRRVADRAEKTFVIGNNHFKGQAPANILQLKKILTGERVKAPPSLLEAFPMLEAWTGGGGEG